MKHKDIVRRRDKLAADLPTSELLRGSLLQRTIRHKSGCPKCERGEGHPVSVLAVSEPGGKVRQISLRPDQKPVVEQWCADQGIFTPDHNAADAVVGLEHSLRLFSRKGFARDLAQP